MFRQRTPAGAAGATIALTVQYHFQLPTFTLHVSCGSTKWNLTIFSIINFESVRLPRWEDEAEGLIDWIEEIKKWSVKYVWVKRCGGGRAHYFWPLSLFWILYPFCCRRNQYNLTVSKVYPSKGEERAAGRAAETRAHFWFGWIFLIEAARSSHRRSSSQRFPLPLPLPLLFASLLSTREARAGDRQ